MVAEKDMEKKIKRTPAQLAAIQTPGRVLVSASAGAGKTSVMIERLCNALLDGADVGEVLAVTFTKKAAAQMKEKLRAALLKKLKTESDSRICGRIYDQLAKLNSADICTIHSLCSRLVRTYHYVLGIDSSFEILANEADVAALKNKVIDELFEDMYKVRDERLFALLDKLRKRRSDSKLKKLIIEAYDNIRVNDDYVEKLKGHLGAFTEEGFERVALEYSMELEERCSAMLKIVREFRDENEPVYKAEKYNEVLDDIEEVLSSYKSGANVFDLPKKATEKSKPSLNKDKAEQKAIEYDNKYVAVVNAVKDRFKKLVEDIGGREEEKRRFLSCAPLADAFINMLLEFDGAYSRTKREEGKLDYGDLEQYTYNLLCKAPQTEEEAKGLEEVRKNISDTYKLVFVDEYQDVNPIQDKIISAIADKNYFYVGDVKQAIYGFRGSRSLFFTDKQKDMKKEEGANILLPDNFRSTLAVKNFVNDLFSKVMTKELCSFNYSEGHKIPTDETEFSRYPKEWKGIAKFCSFAADIKDKEEVEGVYSIEAAQIKNQKITNEGLAALSLVRRMVGTTFYDTELKGEDKERAITPGDICVLTRKRSNKSVQSIMRAVGQEYPVAGVAEVNVCDRPEIKLLLNVLSYIDNSQQDIPLASAMLSPVGKFTEEQLAKIRVYGGSVEERPTFRRCVRLYVKANTDEISQKIKAFEGQVKRLKKLSQIVGAGRLIDEVVNVSGFASVFGAPNKTAALRCLQSQAYGPAGELFLTAFLLKIKNTGYKITAPASLATDCVKVMTMHASKGLEFPVVIVADVAATFSGEDKSEMPYGKFGFAPRYFNEEDKSYKNTFLRKLYKLQNDREELANEINLLYVACTRARYALFVLVKDDCKYSRVDAPYTENYAGLFNVKDFNPEILNLADPTGRTESAEREEEDGAELADMLSIANFKYPHPLGTELPVKSSASRLIADRNDDGFKPMFDEEEEAPKGENLLNEGVAYHRFLQLANLAVKDEEGIKAQIEEFTKKGLITEEQQSILNAANLSRILSMPAFNEKIIATNPFREREFVCRIPSEEYLKLMDEALECTPDGNAVIVQGAIDFLSVEKEGGVATSATINDYKYSAHSEEYLKEKYTPQLALYKSVVCKIYNLPPEKVKCTIINIRALKQIDLNV